MTTLQVAAEQDLNRDFVGGGYATAVRILSLRLVTPKRISLSIQLEMAKGLTVPFMIEGDL